MLAGVPMAPEEQQALQDAIDDNLQHPNDAIRARAAAALHAFSRACLAGAQHRGMHMRRTVRAWGMYLSAICGMRVFSPTLLQWEKTAQWRDTRRACAAAPAQPSGRAPRLRWALCRAHCWRPMRPLSCARLQPPPR